MTVRRVLALVVGAIWLVLTVPALGLAAMSVMASDGGVNARMRFVAIGSALPFVALAVAFGAIAFGAGAAPVT